MKIKKEKNIFNVDTVCFNKPYRNPVYKCTGSRQGFTKLAIYNAFIHYSVNIQTFHLPFWKDVLSTTVKKRVFKKNNRFTWL